jgi:phosphohistidine phosphatase
VILYLVQHGTAMTEAEDPARPLSPAGREDIQRLAALFVRSGATVAEIRHSGKRRAEETAGILAAAVSPAAGVRAVSGLAPNDPVTKVAAELAMSTDTLMLVGHLPHLGRLAALLLAGREEPPILRFVPGTAACLERAEVWSLAWCLPPTVLRC